MIRGLHYDVTEMKGAVVFGLVLPGGGKTLPRCAVQSRCLDVGRDRTERGLDTGTLWPCWRYKPMLKLKVAAGFQVLTIERRAQPTLVHLLKLVKVKIHSAQLMSQPV